MEKDRFDEVRSIKLLEHLINRISADRQGLHPVKRDEFASEDEKREVCCNYNFSSPSDDSSF